MHDIPFFCFLCKHSASSPLTTTTAAKDWNRSYIHGGNLSSKSRDYRREILRCPEIVIDECDADIMLDKLESKVEIEVFDASCNQLYPATAHSKRRKSNVRFSVVQIQQYNVTLGDHPYTKHFPMSLDWEHTQLKEIDLSAYETSKQSVWTPVQRLTMWDRCARLTKVTGVLMSDLHVQEKERQLKLDNDGFGDKDVHRKFYDEESVIDWCDIDRSNDFGCGDEDSVLSMGAENISMSACDGNDKSNAARTSSLCKSCDFWE